MCVIKDHWFTKNIDVCIIPDKKFVKKMILQIDQTHLFYYPFYNKKHDNWLDYTLSLWWWYYTDVCMYNDVRYRYKSLVDSRSDYERKQIVL